MAQKLVTANPHVRVEGFGVNPDDVIVKEELRGRWKPVEEEIIKQRAISIFDEGQKQPAVCLRNGDFKPVLTAGFCRHAAVQMIRKGFQDGDRFIHVPDLKFKITVMDGNEQDGVLANIAENRQREATTDVDDAMNQRRLRDQFGMTDAQIAKKYGYHDQSMVSKLRKLLMHPESILELVHTRKLALAAALALFDVPEKERLAAVKQAISQDGKVDASKIRSAVREAKPEGKGKGTAVRSRNDIKTYITWFKQANTDPKSIEFADKFLLFLEGGIKDATMTKYLNDTFGSKGK